MDCTCNIKIVSSTHGCGYLESNQNGEKRRLFPQFRLYRTETEIITIHGADGKTITIPSSCEVSVDGAVYDDFEALEDALLNLTCTLNDINVNATIDKTGLATEQKQDDIVTAIESLDNQSNIIRGNTSNRTQVASNDAVIELLPANPNRIRTTIVNESDQDLYVIEGSGGSITDFTWKVSKRIAGIGGQLVIDDYTGVINGIWDSINGNAVITEITEV